MKITQTGIQTVPPKIVFDFLNNSLPFNELDEKTLNNLAKRCIIEFYPAGTLIFQQEVTEVNCFYLIQKGGVKIYLKDNEGDITLKDFRGEGEYFGALPLIHGTAANLNIETVEDTFCFQFNKEVFQEILDSNPKVTQYFLRTMSEKLVKNAYAELRQHKVCAKTESSLYLFSVQLNDIIKGEPQSIPAEDSIQNAAIQMANLKVGSLIVKGPEGENLGIVTDRDLRIKVVAAALDYQTPVKHIMSSPIHTIESHNVCFDALLHMMHTQTHHLAVIKQEEIVGVITTHDLMVLQGHSPLYLFREIMSQRKIEGLYNLSSKVPLVVRNLIEEGAKANNITRMITIINDQILNRLLTLLIEELGPPPVNFCWLLMGSEGRKEQTFWTDQDNALVYDNPEDDAQREESERYFKEFGEKAIKHLVGCGFPECPGNIMASNPKLRKDINGWSREFDRWMYTPDPEEILNSTIFFDFRGGYGDQELAKKLRLRLCRIAPEQDMFQRELAKDCLTIRPPLSFFRNFIVEKNGDHRNTLNIKESGIAPVVDFARLMSLKHGIRESNTLERLQLLAEHGYISTELYTESTEAYEFLMQLRLVHQLHLLEIGHVPDNYIKPADLSDLEKSTLKEAFEVIRRIQSSIQSEFRLRD
jgi:CBS domain-containing protein